jgi:tetratricopeptide (TPR) repeat protein
MVAISMGDENKHERSASEGDSEVGPVPGTEPGGEPAGSGVSVKDMTPGQRLLAKKTAKADQKRELKDELKRKAEDAKKAEEAEVDRAFGRTGQAPVAPDQVQRAAVEFSSYLQGHRAAILVGVLSVVGIGFAWIYGKKALSAGSAEQTGLLAEASAVATGGIDPSDDDGKDERGKPVYKTVEARDRAALDAYTKALAEGKGSVAAGWAALAQGAIQLRLGRGDDAVKTFADVLASHRADPLITARALESLGIALEAAGKTDEAKKRFEELKAADKGQGALLADYHLGRLELAKGDRAAATALLKGVYDKLVEAAARNERSAYLKGEVESRLAELDSKLVPNLAPSDPGQMDPAELQRLIEQLQRSGAGK